MDEMKEYCIARNPGEVFQTKRPLGDVEEFINELYEHFTTVIYITYTDFHLYAFDGKEYLREQEVMRDSWENIKDGVYPNDEETSYRTQSLRRTMQSYLDMLEVLSRVHCLAGCAYGASQVNGGHAENLTTIKKYLVELRKESQTALLLIERQAENRDSQEREGANRKNG